MICLPLLFVTIIALDQTTSRFVDTNDVQLTGLLLSMDEPASAVFHAF